MRWLRRPSHPVTRSPAAPGEKKRPVPLIRQTVGGRLPERKISPELAVLSALAHGAEESDTLSRALLSIDAIQDHDRRRAYFDLVRCHLGAALDRALEALMATSERPYLSDFANGERRFHPARSASGEETVS
jgi:hypothetical protein